MRYFNSLQLVILFVAWPFIIHWLADATFRGSAVAFYSACALYVVQVAWTVCAYARLLEDW